MRWCVVFALGLCGCDALFGLDPVTGGSGSHVTITASTTRRFLHDDIDHVPVLEPAPIPDVAPFVVRHQDGSAAEITWDRSGTLSFKAAAGERYSIIYDKSQGLYEYQLAAPTVAFDDIVLGRPDQMTPDPSTAIEWDSGDISLTAAELQLATIGIWSNNLVKPATTGAGNFTVASANMGFFVGQSPALLDAASHDALFVFHITANSTATPAFRWIDRWSVLGDVTQNPTGTTTFSSSLAPMPTPFCTDACWNHSADQARFAQLYPEFSTPGGDTRLWSSPLSSQITLRAPVELALVFSNATDAHFAFSYGNPFGYDVQLVDNTYVKRTIGGGMVVTANAQYVDVVVPTSSCTVHPAPSLVAPLAYAATLDGAPIIDGIVLASNGVKPIELHWSVDSPEPVTVTQVNLLAGNKVVRQYLTVDDTVLINPVDLTANTKYWLQILPYVGYFANAAAGDFVTRVYPLALGVYPVGTFSISKP